MSSFQVFCILQIVTYNIHNVNYNLHCNVEYQIIFLIRENEEEKGDSRKGYICILCFIYDDSISLCRRFRFVLLHRSVVRIASPYKAVKAPVM
jgi:hypothetical protein